MADGSKIEWTDATWNPVTGCSIVSPGCTNCYAMRLAGTRMQHHPSRVDLTMPTKTGPVWNGAVRLNEGWLTQPLGWKRPRMVFVCAHGDLFHESVSDAWIDQVFAVMALAPQHTFQVLTKRAARMREYLTAPHRGRVAREIISLIAGKKDWRGARAVAAIYSSAPLPNVWIGVSAERQQEADERVPHLLQTPAAVRFVSAEPLLGPIDFTRIEYGIDRGSTASPGHLNALTGGVLSFALGTHESGAPIMRTHEGGRLDQVIAGGESGSRARPMHPDWARHIRDQCVAADVAFFFKQWGAWRPIPARADLPGRPQMVRAGDCFIALNGASHVIGADLSSPLESGRSEPMRRAAEKGRLLDGVEWNGMPGAPT